jgi:TatD DNase family protein
MIDLHCHIDLYPDPPAVVARAVSERMYVLVVTTTPLAWDGTRNLTKDAPRIQVALGLHPELVAERHREADILCRRVVEARYVGEIGLDGSPPHRACLDLQRTVFSRILAACASHGGRVMSIHSRGAASLVLDALEEHPGAGTAVLHWFSGTARELERAVALGCWFSVGPAMLRGKKGQSLLAAMPQDHVLTESDGPFTRSGPDPLMPWDVALATAAMASIWERPQEEVEASLLENLRALSNLHPFPSTPPTIS